MTSLADRSIAALRAHHDGLAVLIPTLTDDQLTGPSGASEWDVSQVLSHLGSGAEITLAGLHAALTGEPNPGQEFNQGIWDRWNAMTPRERANAFLDHDTNLVEAYEALTADQVESVTFNFPFLPVPLGVTTVIGMRLNEVAQHAWDVRVGIDNGATVDEDAATVLLDHHTGDMGFMLGFVGKADALDAPVTVNVNGYGLVIQDKVSLSPTAADATATFEGSNEALIRLIGGRLSPRYTPDSVSVSGAVSLDDLRRVFGGV